MEESGKDKGVRTAGNKVDAKRACAAFSENAYVYLTVKKM
jgi:hypothetical protein